MTEPPTEPLADAVRPIQPVAVARTEFPTKFGIPRQAGLVPELRARIELLPPFATPDAVRGIDGFSHLWLIWGFSAALREEWSPLVRPPRLGGDTKVGVFASRSPFRPNGLGLSSVRLLEVVPDAPGGPVLVVGGADLMDGTPIYDIKPYVAADAHPDATLGFTAQNTGYAVEVDLPDELAELVPAEHRAALVGVLAQDPRPAWQRDPDRVHGVGFAGLDVRFRVADGVLHVVEVVPQ
ncbi:MAG: tRNA (N6-threonylcarbamoyladenosine(37)-N6)-methyltransferase TrmO [Propionibacteriaceae bacterium]|nr:tRNA (N6-threonylcarbamoyladenosine(37)-N6)-methyltransferase TrmO [Propionibacteriaceae bacterium]